MRGTTSPSFEPVIIASLAREQGITGVHTHIHQLRETSPQRLMWSR